MIDEIFWLCISLISTIFVIYRPIKLYTRKMLDDYITNSQSIVDEAKKSYTKAKSHLKKLEEDLILQDKLNQKKILDSKQLHNVLMVESQKELQKEVDRQLQLAKIQRKIKEESLVEEITSQFIYENTRNTNLKFNNQLNCDFISRSLKKLGKI